MSGAALLLSAEHAEPHVAAREARRRLADEGTSTDALVAAVEAAGFDRATARDAVAAVTDDADPTRSCASGAELAASDD